MRKTESKPRPSKTCVACGKPFAWRKKWRNCWSQVLNCSERCRSRRAHKIG
ncbi:MAG: DUF2256 domain-containing protein [Rubripirellula sp.]